MERVSCCSGSRLASKGVAGEDREGAGQASGTHRPVPGQDRGAAESTLESREWLKTFCRAPALPLAAEGRASDSFLARNLDAHNINHIIIVVDKSASMYGSRWRSLLRAVDAFQKACVGKGSQDRSWQMARLLCKGGTCRLPSTCLQDKVTVITFDLEASSLVKAAPITSDIVTRFGQYFVCLGYC